ncbi:MAG: bis(5'-nucleosyl)-tetraphosphatase (symmetrical) [Thiobacillus sp. 63-78]|uniref:symmetrical bis(5'-nucleosyl)-tetraphosphatase n=1 Tax=Thiobacillus sp. 63-78 TaxID=1895859 RepID=UPI00095E28CF|nr:symmetrical bis(5'-nucleosyl)-tetraphosphatase [Thiobacillus sp. 63-78]OJZ15914.1 MAG: bis(5'-nucleosyl)-tetraphosphatase (symmetrical) [Thiobacillus sp. 63-78]
MSTYAIGDPQGCQTSLLRLLDEVKFDPAADRLWLVGDLVNRGPDSLAVLRFVKNLGSTAISVLGNHDLHLLALAEGYGRAHKGDTLDAVLAAPDRDELLHWLRQRKLAWREGDFLMVHAGVLPGWTLDDTMQRAAEAEAVLHGAHYRDFFAQMYGNAPVAWDGDLQGVERLRVIVNAFTRLRYCTPTGEMEFHHKGAPGTQPAGWLPWFEVPGRQSAAATLVFGHWSTLGLVNRPGLIALDTGCLWGGKLSAVRLEDRQAFAVQCPQMQHPGRP